MQYHIQGRSWKERSETGFPECITQHFNFNFIYTGRTYNNTTEKTPTII